MSAPISDKEADFPSSPDQERRGSRKASVSAPGLASDEDAAVLAKLGYKQELRRNFTMIEVFGIAFSIMGLLPSIASTLSFSVPAGPVGMVWGWFVASGFIFIVGLAMADLGLVGGLCSIDYGFALMFLSVIVIARDGEWSPSSGIVYVTFMACVFTHGIIASTMSKIMGKLQTVFVIMNFILIFATIIALPIGAKNRHDGSYIFGKTENLTTWPVGWAWFLSWLSPIWTIGAFDSCVHMSEEAANATRAVPYAACIDPVLDNVTGSNFGQPMAQIYYDALGKHAWTAIIFLIFGILLAMFPVGGPNPSSSDMNYTVVINSAVWGGALLYYFIDARKWFKGPKITVDLDVLDEEQEEVLRQEGLEIEGLEGQGALGKEAKVQ
ncbi:MAG: hypothetical protein Q9227_000395 [Pyrenula ochraceoflavens]